jgi:hypothetical protein
MSHLVEDAWMTIEANLDEVPTARSHILICAVRIASDDELDR